ncbi:MAG: homoserine O-acetyltransferase [Methanocorpusculum sp.]|nr:homoserine O-acetyltransferase [Methanocorpusculum sp.]
MMYGDIGEVKTKIHTLSAPLHLESGAVLSGVNIAYETYGCERGKNIILVCHALSGDAHAAGYHEGESKPGWWDGIIGPKKALDTSRYCVIVTNVLGGCKGTTGPSSLNPATGKPYGRSFPVVTIRDMVACQHQFLTELGVHELYAIVGGSMGGMQAMQWAVEYPDFARRIAVVASSGYSTPMHIAFGAVQRAAVMSDEKNGLALARMMAHITYLSEESMKTKFGRRLQNHQTFEYGFDTEFSVESYLRHQGSRFVERFDPDSYLYITKAIDYYDLTKNGSLAKGLAHVKAKFLIISVSSDWLYPPHLSEELVTALHAAGRQAEYAKVLSPYGHDGFLLENEQMNYLLGRFLTPVLVGDLMLQHPPAICSCATIAQAARVMIEHEVNHLPVTEGGMLKGIVTSWDIAKAVAGGHRDLADIMTADVVTARASDTLADAAALMDEYHISALPVTDAEGGVAGMLTAEIISNMEARV